MLKRMFSEVLCLGLTGLLFSTGVWADAYPSKPIRLINPFATGGYSDLVARAYAKELGDILEQTVIVESKPGAGGSLGMGMIASAKPDGYTIGMGTNGPLTLNQALLGNLSYDTRTDLTAISRFARIPSFVVVPASSGIKDFNSLIELMKTNPGKYSYASGGDGTSQHLAGEMLKKFAQVDVMHIPYKGESPAITDLIGEQVDLAIGSVVATLPHIRSGRIVPLAVTSAQRNPAMLSVPTISESGYPNFDVSAWFGLVAPAGLSPDVKEKLYQASVKAVASPRFQEVLAPLGASVQSTTPAEFDAFIEAEIARWEPVIKDIRANTK